MVNPAKENMKEATNSYLTRGLLRFVINQPMNRQRKTQREKYMKTLAISVMITGEKLLCYGNFTLRDL